MLINGSVDSDQVVARQFCREVLAGVQQRADLIHAICDLDQILDASVLARAIDALAGIRHIAATADDVAEHYKNGQFGALFNKLVGDIAFVGKKAEAKYEWLSKIFPVALNRL